MPSGSSSRSSKPKPSEVAAETKKFVRDLAKKWPAYSYLYGSPLTISINEFPHPTMSIAAPTFWVREGDPVDFATCWSAANNNIKVAFICAANEKRPGGDWETGVLGYEERLCRRSSLSAHLANQKETNYPIPALGGLYSDRVGKFVFRGPHDRYEHRDPKDWRELPVVSVVPVRRPKLKEGGAAYSFIDERELFRNKLRAALIMCAYNNVRSVVIGDFGLGSCRNPPRIAAELWRDVILWDPALRGRIENVAFVFEDRAQSTARLILEDAAKKGGKSSSSSSSSSHHHHSSASSSSSKGKSKASGSSSSASGGPTDYDIFTHVFDPAEITRVLAQPDMRMGVPNLMS